MTCSRCGCDTYPAEGHRQERQCLEALIAEAGRLRAENARLRAEAAKPRGNPKGSRTP